MANVKTIKFDASQISNCSTNLHQLSERLKDAKGKLQSAMQDVKDGWKGKGSDAFDNLLTEEWSVGLDRYCELLELLVDIVKEAADTYSQMETNIGNLTYED